MKKVSVCVALALLLTLPVTYGISRIPGLAEWFASGAGYAAFRPLFDALGSIGGEQNTDIIVAVLLIASFALSLVLANAFIAVHERRRPSRR